MSEDVGKQIINCYVRHTRGPALKFIFILVRIEFIKNLLKSVL